MSEGQEPIGGGPDAEEQPSSSSVVEGHAAHPIGLPDELPDDLSPQVNHVIRRSVQVSGILGPLENPLLEKFNAEHIHKLLDYGEAESRRDDQQMHSVRKFALAFFLVALVSIVGVLLVLVWQDERDLAAQILAGLAVFGGGFGTGFGVARRGR